MPEAQQGKDLIQLARGAISERLGLPTLIEIQQSAWLQQPGASFVTLTQQGRLRGCIGSLEAHRPLQEDVRANAVAAAFRDPRFTPLEAAEFDLTEVEVSLLSPQQPLAFRDEDDALAQLRPELDGVILEYGQHRATFLPQVWEQLPDPRAFLGHLKAKAGLPRDFWTDGIKLFRYSVDKWRQADFPDMKTL